MKEEYIWDRTGDDPEIRRLEEALSVFRYRDTEPPALHPSNVIVFPATSRRGRFSFAYAFAACGALIIAIGVWLQIAPDHTRPAEKTALTVPAENVEEKRNQPSASAPNDLTATEPEILNRPEKPKSDRVRAVRTSDRRRRNIVKTSPDNIRAATLTSEEKYAYGQLILALSITGSKLKIVQDKIYGSDDPKKSLTENQR